MSPDRSEVSTENCCPQTVQAELYHLYQLSSKQGMYPVPEMYIANQKSEAQNQAVHLQNQMSLAARIHAVPPPGPKVARMEQSAPLPCEGGAVNRKPLFSAKMGLTDSHVFYMCE